MHSNTSNEIEASLLSLESEISKLKLELLRQELNSKLQSFKVHLENKKIQSMLRNQTNSTQVQSASTVTKRPNLKALSSALYIRVFDCLELWQLIFILLIAWIILSKWSFGISFWWPLKYYYISSWSHDYQLHSRPIGIAKEKPQVRAFERKLWNRVDSDQAQPTRTLRHCRHKRRIQASRSVTTVIIRGAAKWDKQQLVIDFNGPVNQPLVELV